MAHQGEDKAGANHRLDFHLPSSESDGVEASSMTGGKILASLRSVRCLAVC